MRAGFQFAVAVEAVTPGGGAEFSLIPDRQFHCERRKQRRLDAAPAQAGADAEGLAVAGQLKICRRAVVAFVSRIMRRAAQDKVQRYLVLRIEQMINARGNFPAVAVERFAFNPFPAANLVVTVRETAARRADGKIRVWPQPVNEAEFGIQINRRERHAQREVCPQKIRLVMIIKRVARQRRAAFERLVVADLNQVAFDRINLRRSDGWQQQTQPRNFADASRHRECQKATPPWQQASSLGSVLILILLVIVIAERNRLRLR